ncbi:MAG: FmdB family zinc ribbon protein [Planctomycetota bacterium]
MPIYEYHCADCGHEFEFLVRGDEKPTCPSCGRERLTRQMSAPAAHTASGSKPADACPVRQSCGMPNCCGQGCGMGELMG